MERKTVHQKRLGSESAAAAREGGHVYVYNQVG